MNIGYCSIGPQQIYAPEPRHLIAGDLDGLVAGFQFRASDPCGFTILVKRDRCRPVATKHPCCYPSTC